MGHGHQRGITRRRRSPVRHRKQRTPLVVGARGVVAFRTRGQAHRLVAEALIAVVVFVVVRDPRLSLVRGAVGACPSPWTTPEGGRCRGRPGQREQTCNREDCSNSQRDDKPSHGGASLCTRPRAWSVQGRARRSLWCHSSRRSLRDRDEIVNCGAPWVHSSHLRTIRRPRAPGVDSGARSYYGG